MSEFINLSYAKSFFNSITKPTRVTSTSATLIDHIWTNNMRENIFNGILYDMTSDHFPVLSMYSIDMSNEDNDSHLPSPLGDTQMSLWMPLRQHYRESLGI